MNKNSSAGFSLIELAIVITIVSFLMVPAIRMYQTWLDQSRVATNRERIAAIQQSLSNFMAQYGRLPCPSSFIGQPVDTNYDREIVPFCVKKDGSPYVPDGRNTFAATGRSTPTETPPMNSGIIIGAVPVRDLGLPDITREDAYGHLITYAVSAAETTALNGAAGVIDVVDETGHSVLPFAADKTSTGTALYVLVEHGKDGKGGYVANAGPAVTRAPIPCTGAPGLDVLNCSFESKAATPFAFRNAPFGQQPGPNWFDDTVVFYTLLGGNATAASCPAAGNSCTQQLSDLLKSGQLNEMLQGQLSSFMQSGQVNDMVQGQLKNLLQGQMSDSVQGQLKELMQSQQAEPPQGQ